MAYVVVGRCVDCRYTDCAAVCPVDCFYEIQSPRMLVIDPDTCISCHLCAPACPVHACYEEDEVPEPYKEWIEKNRELFPTGTLSKGKEDPLPGAKTLEQWQEWEKAQGWNVSEPRSA
ncbi:MAG: ferredoxin family protein [Phycisphaerae bacterium]|jgi:ferredoxin|nr:ferredoxin family protein [Phycisphaerae bacterium]MCZ2400194.1 ferredoxin family protein [Phycisphaerae bacterium]NUQ49425.1 ferredoxin family protein [Phycisphaerae bacterium]